MRADNEKRRAGDKERHHDLGSHYADDDAGGEI
jgi:hypothetical protein